MSKPGLVELFLGTVVFTAVFGSYGLVVYIVLIALMFHYTKEEPKRGQSHPTLRGGKG